MENERADVGRDGRTRLAKDRILGREREPVGKIFSLPSRSRAGLTTISVDAIDA